MNDQEYYAAVTKRCREVGIYDEARDYVASLEELVERLNRHFEKIGYSEKWPS